MALANRVLASETRWLLVSPPLVAFGNIALNDASTRPASKPIDWASFMRLAIFRCAEFIAWSCGKSKVFRFLAMFSIMVAWF